MQPFIPWEISRRRFLRLVGGSIFRSAVRGVPGAEWVLDGELNDYDAFLLHQIVYPRVVNRGDQYYVPVEVGWGYGTWHNRTEETLLYRGNDLRRLMAERGLVSSELSRRHQRLFEMTDAGIDGIKERIVDQRGWSEDDMLTSDTFAGLLALRGPKDLFRRYLVYRTSRPDDDPVEVECMGCAFVCDYADIDDYNGHLRHTHYSYFQWPRLPWVADLGTSLVDLIPSGRPDDYRRDRGRPGVLLVSEDVYRGFRRRGGARRRV